MGPTLDTTWQSKILPVLTAQMTLCARVCVCVNYFVCVFRYLMYGSGLFPADARRLCPAVAARRGAEGQIQTLPLQRLCRGVCVCVLICLLRCCATVCIYSK